MFRLLQEVLTLVRVYCPANVVAVREPNFHQKFKVNVMTVFLFFVFFYLFSVTSATEVKAYRIRIDSVIARNKKTKNE